MNGYVKNNGLITGGYGGASGDYGVEFSGGTLVNNGTILGSGVDSDGIFQVGGILTNNGTLVGSGRYGLLLAGGSANNYGLMEGAPRNRNAGAFLESGTLANFGTIDGVSLDGGILLNHGFVNDVVSRYGATFVNDGYVGSVTFGTGASRLILDPGAQFGSSIVALGQAKHQIIELASGASSGKIASIGEKIVNFGNLIFDPGASWTIEGNTAGLAASQTISGFTNGDTIVLDNFLSASDSFVTGTGLDLTSGSGTISLDLTGTFATSNFTVTDSGTNTTIVLSSAPCFAAGTRILTARGEVAVEALREDDIAILADSTLEPITWIGYRTIDITRHNRPEAVQPILIEAGALADSIPCRDLVVSPDHAIFLGDRLIPAKTLINGATIRQLDRRAVTYYHVELGHHAILLAEGCPVESYLETGNRGAFANGDSELVLHPDFAQNLRETQSCAPFAESGELVESIRAKILARASLATTSDPDTTISYRNGTAVIASKSAVPGDLNPDPRDRRRLGIKITHLAIDGRPIPLTHPALSEGWHDPEPDGRWTNGAATIPASLLNGSQTVEIRIGATMTYPVDRHKAYRLAC